MRDIYAMKGMAHLRLTSAAIAKMRWIYIYLTASGLQPTEAYW